MTEILDTAYGLIMLYAPMIITVASTLVNFIRIFKKLKDIKIKDDMNDALQGTNAELTNLAERVKLLCQGDLNTKDNENRKEAEAILNSVKRNKQKAPLSPKKFFAREYGKKIPTVFLMSVISLIAFGPILLVFNVAVFLSYLFTVTMAIIFGILEMKKVESYFINDLLEYAHYVETFERESEEEHNGTIQVQI